MSCPCSLLEIATLTSESVTQHSIAHPKMIQFSTITVHSHAAQHRQEDSSRPIIMIQQNLGLSNQWNLNTMQSALTHTHKIRQIISTHHLYTFPKRAPKPLLLLVGATTLPSPVPTKNSYLNKHSKRRKEKCLFIQKEKKGEKIHTQWPRCGWVNGQVPLTATSGSLCMNGLEESSFCTEFLS